MPNRNIRFPILRRLVVKDYGLFPGKDGDGIDHEFQLGVNVVPGVNGIGKTTLLNIIYRLLVGPFDPFKGDERIQLTQRRLKTLKFFDYFSKRDRGASTKGIASGTFSFGENELSVTRSLNDLAITLLAVDGDEQAPLGNDDLEKEIWRLSGCGSQYDFHLLVRSLLFFLEEKMPVVWDPIAQAEIFRILFLSADDASELSQMAYDIQSLDSRQRNSTAQLNQYKAQLASMRARSSAVREVTKRSQDIQTRALAVEAQVENLSEAVDQLERVRNHNRQKLDALKLDLEQATRSLEYLHHQYFASLFPKLSETAKNVLTNLVGENGCLVCGSRRSGLSAQFRKLAKEGACPVCRSPREDQEQTMKIARFGAKAIERQVEKTVRLKSDVAESEKTVNLTEEEYRVALIELGERLEEKDRLEREAEDIQAFLPTSSEKLSETEHYVRFTQQEITKLRRRIRAQVRKYSSKLDALRKEIDGLKKNLTVFFAEYAGSFLAEGCSLTFSPQKLQLGQATEKVEFPTFAVQMTSAVSTSLGTTRKDADDVSESQKEFIDLAFRMAALKAFSVLADAATGAMIVIETPESSLDSIFVNNAGQMLRNWCGDTIEQLNSVIATSNLNRENMISALLGLEDKPRPTKAQVASRILNLLDLAAENAALKLHRKDYESQFRKSTTLSTRLKGAK